MKHVTYRISYALRDEDGKILESREPDNAYEFTPGQGVLLPAIEQALIGQSEGYQTVLNLRSDQAFGEYDMGLVVDVPREQLPGDVDIKVGMRFNTTGPSGLALTVTVIDVDDEIVVLDGNHPLAGINLIVDLRILEIVQDSIGEDGAGGQLH